MTKEEMVAMLRRSVEEWNIWREENPKVKVDLTNANFNYAILTNVNLNHVILNNTNFNFSNLHGANLSFANLKKANFIFAELGYANFSNADLTESVFNSAKLISSKFHSATLTKSSFNNAYLTNANLENANLNHVSFINTNLSHANLINANLCSSIFFDAILTNANLNQTNLREAQLLHAIFKSVSLWGADLSFSEMSSTQLINLELNMVRGLDKVIHNGPSDINTGTFQKSKGEISQIFLEGCGLRDWEIKSVEFYKEGLSDMDIENIVYEIAQLKMGDPIQLHNLFISYSHTNHEFVDAFEPYLKNKGIRFWRDIHDGVAGPMDKIVLRAMENRTVLLIFSEDSINSDWVEFEVENARKLEKQYGRNVLCPIALDASWKDANWSPILMNQVKKYNVLDFSKWKNEHNMGKQFNRLLKGLDIFYKK